MQISYNYTHRGAHNKPCSFTPDLTREACREKLHKLIDAQPRICRIWINDVCVWYYAVDADKSTEQVVNTIMENVL